MIAQHLAGVPELAMVLGPVFLIVAFIRIARRNEANLPDDEEDEWDADVGDLPDHRAHGQANSRAPSRAHSRANGRAHSRDNSRAHE